MISYSRHRARKEKSFYPKHQYLMIKEVVAVIQSETEEHDAIYDFSNQAGLYYFADRKSGARLYQGTYAASLEQQREVISELAENNVALIIWKSGTVYDAVDGLSNEERQALLADYIRKNYPRELEVGSFRLRLRKES